MKKAEFIRAVYEKVLEEPADEYEIMALQDAYRSDVDFVLPEIIRTGRKYLPGHDYKRLRYMLPAQARLAINRTANDILNRAGEVAAEHGYFASEYRYGRCHGKRR